MKSQGTKTNDTKRVKKVTAEAVKTPQNEGVKPRFVMTAIDARTGIPIATYTSIFGVQPVYVAEAVIFAVGASWERSGGGSYREPRWSSEISNPVLSSAVFEELEPAQIGKIVTRAMGSKVGVFEFEDIGDYHLCRVITSSDRSERNRAARAWTLSVLENPAISNSATVRLKRDVPGGEIKLPVGETLKKIDVINSAFGAPSRELLGMDRFEMPGNSQYFGLAEKCLMAEERVDGPAFVMSAVYTEREYDLAVQRGVPAEVLDTFTGKEYTPAEWASFILNKAMHCLRRSGGEVQRLFRSAIQEADRVYSDLSDGGQGLEDYAKASLAPLIKAASRHCLRMGLDNGAR